MTAAEETPVEVRPAERADLLAVMRIERASFPQPWPYDAFERFLGRPGFLVALEPAAVGTGGTAVESVVGFVVADLVRSHGRPLGHVKDLAVHPDRRGRGAGSRLLEGALAALGPVESVKLEVREGNEAARSLYRRYGFEPLRRIEGYYENGDDAVVMIRDH